MNKKLLFSLTTISLLLLSSIGFSQTLELGTLSSFGAFSGTGGIANSGQIEGDTGTYNGIFSGNGSNSGQQYPSGSPTSAQAQIDVLRVYVHLSDVFVTNAGTHSSVFGNGETIFPGVYSTPGAGSVTGTLTLDGLGNSDAVFIIKFEGALTVGASATIVLSNGTKAANVYWISEGAITLGANSVVRGSVFAHPGGITVGANGTIEGRLITSEGAVTVGAGGSLVIPVGPSDIQINCLGTCNSNPNVDILGSVKSFAMFTSSGAVSNAATSGFIGDIGTNAGAITGIQTGATTHVGNRYIPGIETAQAAQDLSSAYNQLMAIQNTDLGHIPLFGNGETMQPGVYYIAGAGSLQGTIVLDGNFDPDAIFIFKFLGAFTVTAQSKIILKNGARRCNVFWVSGAGGTGAIDIGTFAFMKGTFLAHGGACTAAANVNLEGRLLSTAGAIGFSTGVIYNDTLCFEDEIAIVKTGLFVDANGDQCADVGETIDYIFTVTKQGDGDIANVVITDPLFLAPNPIVPIVLVSGDNGDGILNNGEVWIFNAAYTITQNDINAGSVLNTAEVDGDSAIGAVDTATSNTVTVLICQNPEIALIKISDVVLDPINNCYDVSVGGLINYTFSVKNTGTVALNNISVSDLNASVTVIGGPISLDPSEEDTTSFTASYVVTQSDIDAGLFSNQATASGTPLVGVAVTDLSDNDSYVGSDATDTAICTAASIALIKISDVVLDPINNCYDVSVGGLINYTFSVKNTGTVALNNISVSDLNASVTVIGGPISLDPSEEDTTSFTASYVVTQSDIDAGLFSNQATASGTPLVGVAVTDLSDNDSYVGSDATDTAICTAASIALIKISDVVLDPINNCYDVSVGGLINYTFSVKNTGTVALNNISVSDLNASVTVIGGPISLDPSEEDTTSFTASYVVTQSDIDAGLFSNQATASGTPLVGVAVTDLSDNDSYVGSDATDTAICTAASIALIKISDVVLDPINNCYDVSVGGLINYTFSVKNTGTVALNNISVSDLNASVTVIGGPISLDPSEEDTTSFTASYVVTQSDIDAGLFSNQATASGTPLVGVAVTDLSDNDSYVGSDATDTAICTAVSIALIKISDVVLDPINNCYDVSVGGLINYTFSVKNTGTVTLNNISVSDLNASVTVIGGPISLDPSEEDTTSFTASYVVTQSDIDAGLFSNQATASGTPLVGVAVTDLSDNDSYVGSDATDTAICTAASIALIKISDVVLDPINNCYDVSVGGLINYTFSVKNTGTVALNNISVSDLNASVTVIGGPISLDPSEEDTTSFTASYVVTQSDIDAGLFSNQATASGTPLVGVAVTDLSDNDSYVGSDATDTAICTAVSIALIKISDVVLDPINNCYDVSVGGLINYTFSVKNTGTVALNNISVSDLNASVTVIGGPISLDPSEEDTTSFTASYVVTQSDIDAGLFSNQATASGTPLVGVAVTDLSDNDSYVGSDATDTAICTAASIALIKISDVVLDPINNCYDVSVGGLINYTFSVKNTGTVALNNISVSDLNASVTVIGGPISLDPSEEDTTSFTASYVVTQSDIDAGLFSNQATASGTPLVGVAVTDLSDNDSYVGSDATDTAICTTASIALIKISDVVLDPINNCYDVSVGGLINYTFSVKNTGTVALNNISVSDLNASVTVIGGPISLDPSEEDTTSFTASYVVTQSDIDAGLFSNQATASGAPLVGVAVTDLSDNDSYVGSDATDTAICTAASIALIKISDVVLDPINNCYDVSVGGLINYTFSVKNTGTVALNNISVSDLNASVTVIGGPISLDPSEEDTTSFTASYVVTQSDIDAGLFSNQATASGTPLVGVAVTDLSDNDSYVGSDATDTAICTTASIALIKISDVVLDPINNCYDVSVGGLINYTFSVKNTGTVTLNNISVSDLNASVTVIGGPISLDPSEEDTTSFTASYVVTQSDIDAGLFSNQATASGAPLVGVAVTDLSDNDSYVGSDATDTAICTAASIALIKISDVVLDPINNCYDVSVGGLINYTFSVKNTGTVALNNISVSDLNASVTVIGGPISLDPSEEDTTSFTASYVVTQSDIDAGLFSNQATASGTPLVGVAVTDLSDNDSYVGSDATDTAICTAASIALIKISDVVLDPINNCYDVSVGGLINYTFSVKNTGTVALNNISVSDLNASVTVIGGPISLDPSEEDTTSFTASYVVTQSDIDAGLFSNQATASGTPLVGVAVTDLSDNDSYVGSDATDTAICTAASIALIKISDVVLDPINNCYDVSVGGLINYTFSVKNTGTVTLNNISVSDLNASVTVIGGPISLDPSEEDTTSFTASYVVTQSDIDAGLFSNQATASGTPLVGVAVTDLSDNDSYVGSDATDTAICTAVSIALIKISDVVLDPINNCYDVSVGGLINYTFSVKNTGTVTLNNISVSDLNASVTVIGGPISLDPSEEDTTSFTASYVVTQSDIDAGLFSNQATASGTPLVGVAVTDLSDNDSYVGSDATDTAICTAASIALIKISDVVLDPINNCYDVSVGGLINYTFSVKNTGTVTLNNISVSDLNASVTVIGGPISLDPSEEDTTSFTASYVVTQSDIDAGLFSNQATASGAPLVGVAVTDLSDNDSYVGSDATDTAICTAASIALIKISDVVLDPINNCYDVSVGGLINYTFSVKNTGTVALNNISVSDLNASVTVIGGPISLDPSEEDTTSFTASYVVTQSDIDAGLFSNQATASGTPLVGVAVTDLSDNDSYVGSDATDTAICTAASIALIKISDVVLDPINNCYDVSVGGLINYTFSVKNTGTVALNNISVSDLNASVTVIGGPISLDPSEEDTTSFTASYVVTQSDIDAGLFSNQATASGTPLVGVAVTDLSDNDSYVGSDATDTAICTAASIALIKISDVVLDPINNCYDVSVGGLINYTFSVKNTGTVTLNNISVSDLNASVTVIGGPISLDPSEEDTTSFTASYVVTQSDIDAGLFSNQATASGAPLVGVAVTDLSDNDSYVGSDATDTAICTAASIALIKISDVVLDPINNCYDVSVGGLINYTFSVKNTGTVTLNNISVSDLNASVTVIGGPISLDPSEEDTTSFTASYVVTQSDIDAGLFSNQATASGTPLVGVAVTDLSDNDSYVGSDATDTAICTAASIALIKISDVVLDPINNCYDVSVGGLINYTFSVKNTGTVALNNISVSDLNASVTVIGGPISLDPSEEDTTSFTASYVVTQSDIDAGLFSNQATASGTPLVGVAVTDLSDNDSYVGSDATDTAICTAASIALIKISDVVLDPINNCYDVSVGGLINYTFSVKNTGTVTLNNISVSDLNASVTVIGGPISLDPSEEDTTSFTASYVVTQSDIDAGLFSNQATASGTPLVGVAVTDLSDNDSYVGSDATDTAICTAASIALIKISDVVLDPINNCYDVSVGGLINYTFSVKNTGTVTLNNISVSDLNASVTVIGGPISLDPSEEDTTSFTASYVVTQSDIDAGLFSNQATASGTPLVGVAVTDLSDNDSYVGSDATDTAICTAASIALIKISDVVLDPINNCYDVSVGGLINYTFSVKNTGTVTLNNISVSDLNASVTVIGGPISLDPSEEDTTSFTASYVVTQSDIDAGLFSNQATASGAPLVGVAVTDLSDNDSYVGSDATDTAICTAASIALIKISDVVLDPINNCYDVSVGGLINYTFSVKNTGTVALNNISVSDLNASVTVIGGPISLDPSEEDTTSFTASYVVTQSDIDAGLFSNQATASGTPLVGVAVTDLSDNDSYVGSDATDTAICTAASIALIKISDVVLDPINNCYDVSVGGLINYTFSVKNTGTVALNNISVSDLNASVTVIGGPISLDPSEEDTTSFTASYVVTQSDIDAGLFSNQATASGTPLVGVAVTDLSDNDSYVGSDATDTAICTAASIALIKISDVVLDPINNCYDVSVGGLINYTFSVKNTGTVTLNNISVSDLNASVTVIGGPISLDPSEEDTTSFTASYVVTQSDIDAGLFSNQATASGTPLVGVAVTDLSDNDSYVGSDATDTAICTAASIALIKISDVVLDPINNCYDVSVGGLINYTFSVKNTGTVTLNNISVSDLNASVTVIGGPISLDPSEEDTTSFTASYVVTQSDIDAGLFSNQATASGTPLVGVAVTDLSDNDSYVGSDATDTAICTAASIALIKISDVVLDPINNCYDVSVGGLINYTFSVKNTGTVALNNISVSDLNASVTVIGGPISLDPSEEDTTSFTASYVVTQSDIDAGLFSNQATASGTPLVGVAVTDLSDNDSYVGSDATDTAICTAASIALIKISDVVLDPINNCYDVSVGGLINYTFSVKNTGTVALNNISVSDLNASVTVIGGPISLDPSEEDTTSFTASYVVTQSDIDAGLFSNQATASGTPLVGVAVTDLSDNDSYVGSDATVTVLCQEEAIAIIKTGVFNEVNGNDCADAEIDTVTYTFTVTNEGGSAITSVTVTDPLLGGLLTAIPTGDTDGDNELDVTETWVYVQGYTITQSDIDTGSISNQATADGTGSTGPVSDLSDDNLTTEDDVTVTVLCQNDSIALIKTGVFNDSNGDSCADVDETITYSFTVINNGNTTIGNIAITDALVNVQGGPITLAPGATDDTTFTATYLITQANIDNGNVTNTATASGFNPLGVVVSDISDDSSELEDDVTITVLCQNDSIALIKTGVFNDSNGDSCADVDETITYSFTVINNGNTTIGNIAITDALVNVQGGPITLAPGQTDTTTFTATYLIIQPDINTGSVTNTATASGFNPLGVVVSDISDVASELEDAPTVTLLCNNAVIALIKTGIPTDENGDGCIDLGETIVYDFVVTNLGNVTLTNVIVTDPMITVNGGSITLFAGDSDTETFSGSYTIVQSDIDAGQVSNQAIAEGLDPLGVVVNDLSDNNSNLEDDATISLLCQDPIIALEKTGIFNDENSNLISEVGETISYTFVVTNRGNVTLFNIAIVDPFPRVVIEGGPIFQLLPGEIDDTTFTATYTITAQDVENGEVLNQAIVSATTFDGDEVTDLSDDPTDFTDADSDGDGDPDDITVVILPNVDAPFDVFNAVSPDGNNQNDFFLIQGISEFPDNTVEIYNRWGVLVWEASGYGGSNDAENVFVGESNGRATVSQDKLLITGTYYYVIKFNGNNPGQDSYAGYLYLNR